MYEATRSNTLQRKIEQPINDPLRFVLFAFAWGEGELRPFTGPDTWQRAVLSDIREALLLCLLLIKCGISMRGTRNLWIGEG